MNPVIVIDSLARAGAERSVSNLAAELVKHGLRVLVVSLTDHVPLAEEMRSAGVEVATLGHTGALRNLPAVVRTGARLRGRIQAHRASLVHSHLYIPDILSRLVTPAGIPILTTLHSVDPWWHHRDRLRSRLKTSVDVWTGRLGHSRHVAVSEAVRDAATVALGIEKERMRVIPNGVHLEKFSPRERRETPGPVIIQVGKLYEHKGQANALRAFKLVTGAIPEARLVFVGRGRLQQKLERLRAELGLHEAVTFAGETEDVAGALQSASVAWMPSEREGLPLACLEAMAMQLPVVASRVGGLPEVVVDGVTGYLVPPGDAEVLASKTIEILLHRGCGDRMGKSGRTRVEQLFRMEQTAERYLQAYGDLRDGRW